MTHPRQSELDTLVNITNIPTAAGQEWRVVRAIEAWVASRPGLALASDAAGNLVVRFAEDPGTPASSAPLFITAHMDHPAFVVERVIGPATFELSFRGGVNDAFFIDAPITLFTQSGQRIEARLIGDAGQSSGAGKHYLAEIVGDDSDRGHLFDVGCVARWSTPDSEIIDAVLHAPACDDLAALAAAICTMDRLLAARQAGGLATDVRLLFTRAEEIGFIGAIASAKLKTMPTGSRIIALENSRAFPDSPVGGGPIVRVGDRISIFSPWLTAACASRAEAIFGGAATPRATETARDSSKRPWQRKLMAGGACEASVFCAHGYDATCICLPLGNYHNMPHLAEHQAGTYDPFTSGPARCEREFIHTEDYLGMIDLLVALGHELPGAEGFLNRLDKLYQEKKYVLGGNAQC